jgi:hypothetical protein
VETKTSAASYVRILVATTAAALDFGAVYAALNQAAGKCKCRRQLQDAVRWATESQETSIRVGRDNHVTMYENQYLSSLSI